MKPKVYLETSIISYLASQPSRDLIVAANQQITHEWWANYPRRFDAFISPLVIQEINSGDKEAASRRLQVVNDIALLQLDNLTVLLAENLVQLGAVPKKATEDAPAYCYRNQQRHGLPVDLELQAHRQCCNARQY